MKRSKLIRPAYFNREFSAIAFNKRVLQQALDSTYPLLERMRFLSFVSSNLDEFYEIRVAGLLQQRDASLSSPSFDGLTPRQQLELINQNVRDLVSKQYHAWNKTFLPALKEEGIVFKAKDALKKEEINWLKTYFEREVYPILTPLGVDLTHPFPQLINKSLNLLVSLQSPLDKKSPYHIAIIPVPSILSRIVNIQVKSKEKETYVFLSDVIELFADQLFPGYKLKGVWQFRITCNSDLYIDEEETENLLKKIEKELHKIQRGAAVRLEIQEGVPEKILEPFLHAIHLYHEDTFFIDGPINLGRLFNAYNLLDRPDLKFQPHNPQTHLLLASNEDFFANISRNDILLHHPYESFTPVVEMIQRAAEDPQVFAIKQTLYRISGESPIVDALKKACIQGKQVTVIVEIKARFDEANNIHWAKELEAAGVHVVYGIVGLKTHCKCCLVVRHESPGFKYYVHLGTGNYNIYTARSYSDFSLFTSDTSIGNEVADLFNVLTGYSLSPNFKKLLVAPFNLYSEIEKRILREIENARKKKPARMIIKVNHLVDPKIIDYLYEASQAGVKIDLIVRSICCLIPEKKGLSENIQVHSILGRNLEHNRIFYFENAGKEPDLFLSSADWMPRNFLRRIEIAFPVQDSKLRKHLIDNVLMSYLRDNQESSTLCEDGSYQKIHAKKSPFSAQRSFYQHTIPG